MHLHDFSDYTLLVSIRRQSVAISRQRYCSMFQVRRNILNARVSGNTIAKERAIRRDCHLGIQSRRVFGPLGLMY